MARSEDRSLTRITTGQLSWDAGVDSSKLTTIASEEIPTGLKRNQLAWLINGTVRGGGITTRPGWKYLATMPFTALFQDASMYVPDFEMPYIMAVIGGRVFRAKVDGGVTIDEVTIAGDANPADAPKVWMQQAELFLVIQDGSSLPLFWDGTSLRRSDGPQVILGTLAFAFNAPAQYDVSLLSLAAPFWQGYTHQSVLIGNTFYLQVDVNDFGDLKNINDPRTGVLLGANTPIYDAAGTEIAALLVPANIPTMGSTRTPIFVSTTQARPQTIPVKIDGYDWELTLPVEAPIAANEVYVVNLTDTPTTAHLAGVNLYSVPEIPAAEAMDYYMGRLWFGKNREYAAGDIVLGPSGSWQYALRDSVLKMTENAYLVGGGSFITPTNDGAIRGINHTANQDSSLGQGTLYVFTPSAIYAVHVTPDRASWATQETPLQTVSQRGQGAISDRAIVPVNGDLFYRSPDGIRSLQISLRYQEQWANTPISNEETRVLDADDRALLRYCSGVEFDNRLLMTCLPTQTDFGVTFKGIIPLDFDLISSIGEKRPPAWEGMAEGLDFLKILTANFGGLQRTFGLVLGRDSQEIEIWELTLGDRFDNNIHGDSRITMAIETPSFNWGRPFELVQLESGELWIDRLFGTADFQVWYRPGSASCWYYWCSFRECAAQNECDLIPPGPGPCVYPEQDFAEQYRSTLVFPHPRASCNPTNKRNTIVDYGFQVRIVVTGHVRIRGLYIYAKPFVKAAFQGLACP